MISPEDLQPVQVRRRSGDGAGLAEGRLRVVDRRRDPLCAGALPNASLCALAPALRRRRRVRHRYLRQEHQDRRQPRHRLSAARDRRHARAPAPRVAGTVPRAAAVQSHCREIDAQAGAGGLARRAGDRRGGGVRRDRARSRRIRSRSSRRRSRDGGRVRRRRGQGLGGGRRAGGARGDGADPRVRSPGALPRELGSI